MKKRVLFVLVFLPGVLTASSLWAQTPLFFDDIGASPRAIALGQAFTAVADDPSAAYYNPAGLSQTPSKFVLGMGYLYSKPRIYIEVLDKELKPYEPHELLEQRSPSRQEDISTKGLWLGIATNFAHMSVFNDPPSFMRNLAFGYVLFYSLPNLNTFWNPQRKQDPYHLRYNYGYCLMSMAMSLSYRITDYLSIGAGVLPRFDTFQDTSGNYIEADKMLNLLDADTGFRLRLKTKMRVYAEYVVGILFHPPVPGFEKRLSVGVAYRRELSGYYGTGYSSDDLVLIDEYGKVTVVMPLKARSVDYIGYNPAQLSVGLAAKPIPKVTVSADITWKDYSEFNFFWSLPPEPRFNDTWIPRIGLEYAFEPEFKAALLKPVDKLRVMGGYYYEPTPVPDMNGEMNILDSDMHVVSIGAGVDYRLKSIHLLKVETYFQVHLANEKVLGNERDGIFGPITTGGEVYGAGIHISIQL